MWSRAGLAALAPLLRPARTCSAISAMSRVSQPSLSANVAASFSLPNRKSTNGSASISVFLNGGTFCKAGATGATGARNSACLLGVPHAC